MLSQDATLGPLKKASLEVFLFFLCLFLSLSLVEQAKPDHKEETWAVATAGEGRGSSSGGGSDCPGNNRSVEKVAEELQKEAVVQRMGPGEEMKDHRRDGIKGWQEGSAGACCQPEFNSWVHIVEEEH